jgi:hypothetical protein
MVVCNQWFVWDKVSGVRRDEESEGEGPEQLQLVPLDQNPGVHEEDERACEAQLNHQVL